MVDCIPLRACPLSSTPYIYNASAFYPIHTMTSFEVLFLAGTQLSPSPARSK